MSPIQWRIETESEVDSTSDLVLDRARGGEPEGLVVTALSQRKGRGRLGRSWHSPAGSGLYFSVLLRPHVAAEQTALLSLVAGVAAAEGLAGLAVGPAGLKWPNDIRIAGRKVGGILCEFENAGGSPPAVVVGIGINLKTPPGGFPEEFRSRTISLEEAGGGEADSPLLPILDRLEHWYGVFLSSGFEPVRSRWEALCDNLEDEITLTTVNDAISGRMRGIDADGRLLLALPDGGLQTFDSGEVTEA